MLNSGTGLGDLEEQGRGQAVAERRHASVTPRPFPSSTMRTVPRTASLVGAASYYMQVGL
jgi:hypothetical protein